MFRDKIGDNILTQLYDYWRMLGTGGRLPARADIDPVDIPRRALPHILLADLLDGGVRIRYRLVGTAMVTEWGGDFTGKFLDEINHGDYYDFVFGLFQDVLEHRCALYSESRFRWDTGSFVGTRRLYMPLASNGAVIDMMLIGQTFSRGEVLPDSPLKAIDALAGHDELVRIHES
jgi:hypothetical protein